MTDTFPLGVFVVRADCRRSDGGPYRGVDRTPYAPFPLDGLTGAARSAWETYWGASEFDLRADKDSVFEALTALRSVGESVEVIYAVVYAGLPMSDEIRAGLVARAALVSDAIGPAPPLGWRYLGFDISHPLPSFHSVLYQPGFGASRTRFPSPAGDAGLCGSWDEARDLAKSAREMGFHGAQFQPIGVFSL